MCKSPLVASAIFFFFFTQNNKLSWHVKKKKTRSEKLKVLKVTRYHRSITVDEYIAIAKEKHGYNVEQVCRETCVCVCVCAHMCVLARVGLWRLEVNVRPSPAVTSFSLFHARRSGLLMLPKQAINLSATAGAVGICHCLLL